MPHESFSVPKGGGKIAVPTARQLAVSGTVRNTGKPADYLLSMIHAGSRFRPIIKHSRGMTALRLFRELDIKLTE